MQFPIGSTVKLADYTSDAQIDRYLGQPLVVSEYREIKYFDIERIGDSPVGRRVTRHIPNYSLITPDGFKITANEHELRASNDDK